VGNMARNVGEDSPKEPCTGRLTPKLRWGNAKIQQ
jgi:hypothetical protein